MKGTASKDENTEILNTYHSATSDAIAMSFSKREAARYGTGTTLESVCCAQFMSCFICVVLWCGPRFGV